MALRLTIFLSAFLLFSVQSLEAKHLLPWFGGSSSVWATCLLFFQGALLLGYLYAHATDRWLRPGWQVRVHLLLLASSSLLLAWQAVHWSAPLLPPRSSSVLASHFPRAQIVWVLTASVGLPFLCLSATSPLLQRWFSAGPTGGAPWRLYALSNAGSLLGLVSYPPLIEPWLKLPDQGKGWGALFLVFAGACGWSAWNLTGAPSKEPGPAVVPVEAEDRLSGMTVSLWLLLSSATSALLVSITTAVCQEIALVPLLWVLPLALYLLTLVLCFDHPRWYQRRGFVLLTAFATLLALLTSEAGMRLGIAWQVLTGSLLLFLFCMTAHGELVRLKPGPRHLTFFYLVVALGGVLGTAAAGLFAPLLLTAFWELHLTVLAGWIILAWVFARDKESFLYRGDPWHFWAWTLFLSLLVDGACAVRTGWIRVPGFTWSQGALFLVAAMAGPALAWALLRRQSFVHSRVWPRSFLVTVILLVGLFLAVRMAGGPPGEIESVRNFYGILRVVRLQHHHPVANCLALVHGQINHGFQYLDANLERQPAGYSSRSSGVGLAIEHHPRRDLARGAIQPLRIGVTGLGVGALAAYPNEGDLIRFYEINPAVIQLAAGPNPRFTFISGSRGRVEIAEGDARLQLERELADGVAQQFDILVLDAFSSDSIPTHLLTVEAFELYLRHLRDDHSVIVVNISNRFLDLRPLVFGLAEHFGLAAVAVDSPGDPPIPFASRYMLLTRDRSFLEQPVFQQHRPAHPTSRRVLWTDQFSNILQLLR